MSGNNRIFRTPPKRKAPDNAWTRQLRLSGAFASAKKREPRASSWWTAMAAPDAPRESFADEITRRDNLRRSRYQAAYGNASNEADE